tara:strand:- start:400 stop:612 length:213 start_codon:yes stop_codon:yes gene_type:complete
MVSQEGEWTNLLAEVFERLTAQHTSTTFEFNDMTFEADKLGTTTKYLPTGKIRINGKITITASSENDDGR